MILFTGILISQNENLPKCFYYQRPYISPIFHLNLITRQFVKKVLLSFLTFFIMLKSRNGSVMPNNAYVKYLVIIKRHFDDAYVNPSINKKHWGEGFLSPCLIVQFKFYAILTSDSCLQMSLSSFYFVHKGCMVIPVKMDNT